MRRSKSILLALALISVSAPAAFAQAAGGNQQIFNDEEQMSQMDNSQLMQLRNQDQELRQQEQTQETADQPYRLYAEQRIKALEKIKNAHGSPTLSTAREKQFYALQSWISHDEATHEQDQTRIRQLDQAIANLAQQRQAAASNLGNDINAMRENQQAMADDDKFNKMMKVNMFNELQSEMGAASWGAPPRDGTYNSVGGYGFQGGYGYSMGGGRRF
jgi:hypothetical protein